MATKVIALKYNLSLYFLIKELFTSFSPDQ